MTPLCSLAEKHGTDKFARHGYTKIYHDLLAGRAGAVAQVLEIGIKRGASLRMWAEFFPAAQILGIDVKHKNLFNEGRIRSVWGDQARADTLCAAVSGSGPFDLIVDDGAHKPPLQANAMVTLLPFLARGGIYVIEDVRHGPGEDPNRIIARVPKGYAARLVLTTDDPDSGLLVIEQAAEAPPPC